MGRTERSKKGEKRKGGGGANRNTEAADTKAGGERGRKTDKVKRPTNPYKPSESGAKGAGGRGGAGARSSHAKGERRRAKRGDPVGAITGFSPTTHHEVQQFSVSSLRSLLLPIPPSI